MADNEPVKIHVRCSHDGGAAEHQRRSTLCNQVLKQMESDLLSCSTTVICVIDDEDFGSLKRECGQANRGYFLPLREGITCAVCPDYFYDLVALFDPDTQEINYQFDSVIYLHDSTCKTDIGMTLSLAHELCHFRQYANQRATWAANQLILFLGPPHITAWADIPIEVEARQVAKRVAQCIFSARAVRDYVAEKAQNPVNKEDGDDWRFIFDLSTSTSYNVVESTRALVEKHRPLLRKIQTRFAKDHVAYRLNLDTLELALEVETKWSL